MCKFIIHWIYLCNTLVFAATTAKPSNQSKMEMQVPNSYEYLGEIQEYEDGDIRNTSSWNHTKRGDRSSNISGQFPNAWDVEDIQEGKPRAVTLPEKEIDYLEEFEKGTFKPIVDYEEEAQNNGEYLGRSNIEAPPEFDYDYVGEIREHEKLGNGTYWDRKGMDVTPIYEDWGWKVETKDNNTVPSKLLKDIAEYQIGTFYPVADSEDPSMALNYLDSMLLVAVRFKEKHNLDEKRDFREILFQDDSFHQILSMNATAIEMLIPKVSFTLLNKNFSTVISDSIRKTIKMDSNHRQVFEYRVHQLKYIKYFEYNEFCTYLAVINQTKIWGGNYKLQVESLATVNTGHDIFMIKKTPPHYQHTILIDGGMLGRDWLSVVGTLAAAQNLMTKYPHLEESIQWLVIPCLNPSAYDYSKRYFAHRFRQKTVIERDSRECPCRFAEQCGVNIDSNFLQEGDRGYLSEKLQSCSDLYEGPEQFSLPESKTLMYIFEKYANISMYISVRAHGGVIYYPYSTYENRPDDWEELETIAKTAAFFTSRKVNRPPFDVLCPGIDLIPLPGSSIDYAKDVQHVKYSFAVYLSRGGASGFEPPQRDLKLYLAEAEEIVTQLVLYVFPDLSRFTLATSAKEDRAALESETEHSHDASKRCNPLKLLIGIYTAFMHAVSMCI